MNMIRCDNGHYYDPGRHSSCPSCGVQDLKIGPTRPGPGATPPPLPGAAPAVSGPPTRTEALPPAGKTVGLMQKVTGIDPTVGWLVCVEGAERGRDYRLRAEKNFIGRSPAMDIAIPGDETLSRDNHATVSFSPKTRAFKIHPGEGRGLVYLNGQEVDSPQPLKAMDIIELGQTKLVFVPFCGQGFQWS